MPPKHLRVPRDHRFQALPPEPATDDSRLRWYTTEELAGVWGVGLSTVRERLRFLRSQGRGPSPDQYVVKQINVVRRRAFYRGDFAVSMFVRSLRGLRRRKRLEGS